MPASPEKLNLASMDVAADKQRLLRQLFPEAFTETTDAKGGDRLALDFDKLKAVLGVHGGDDRAGAGTLRAGLAGETRRAAGGAGTFLRHAPPRTGGIRRLGKHEERLHRG